MERIKNVVGGVISGVLAAGIIVLGGAYIQQSGALDAARAELAEANAELSETSAALSEYKAVYDGLTIFEDGSWTYDKGVDEYFFWDWSLDYVVKDAGTSGNVTEILHCVTEPLDNHGFVQQSEEYDEYVCVNPADYTDFVVVADVHDDINEGDALLLGLNEYSEVIEQVNVNGSEAVTE